MNLLNSKINTPLTKREFEVLNLAMTEKSNKQITEEIFVSINTVKYHLKTSITN